MKEHTDTVTERYYFSLGNKEKDGKSEYGYGSAELLAKVMEVCPRIHLFGHIHNPTGIHAGK